MASYRLTGKATQEIDKIYEYSFLKFGERQADKYLEDMHSMFQLLADNPLLGRSFDELKPELHRFKYESHGFFTIPNAVE